MYNCTVVQDFHFREFMSHFDENGITRVCLRADSIRWARAPCWCPADALEESAELFLRAHGTGPRLGTERREHGSRRGGALEIRGRHGAHHGARILPGQPKPHPTDGAGRTGSLAEVKAASPGSPGLGRAAGSSATL